jgi:tRNA(Ile)-lysidine synthase
VETILLRLLSGAGGVGAAGMTARATLDTSVSQLEIVRPMLDTPRSELAEIVDRLGVAPVTDPTNDDPRFRRNALRRDIIPLLREHFPGFESALSRSVAIAARDAAAIDLLAWREFDLIASTSDIATRVDRRRLRELPEAISTRVIRLAAARLMPDNRRELTFERVERVRNSVDGRSGARIELPYGVIVTVEREHLVFERRDPAGD